MINLCKFISLSILFVSIHIFWLFWGGGGDENRLIFPIFNSYFFLVWGGSKIVLFFPIFNSYFSYFFRGGSFPSSSYFFLCFSIPIFPFFHMFNSFFHIFKLKIGKSRKNRN